VSISPKPKPARREPTQRRARQTVDAVLDAVTVILKREGVDAVTTNRLAEVAGVSIGSVYQYFPDKRAIFRALHDRHAEAMGSLVERTLVGHAASPRDEMLRGLVEALIDAHAADPHVHELLSLEVPHRAEGAHSLEVRLANALRLALGSAGAGPSLERRIFVLTHMVEALAHGAVLRRPPSLSFAAAREEAVRAVLAYVNDET
jgi:AcrR family transcriptional regulator